MRVIFILSLLAFPLISNAGTGFTGKLHNYSEIPSSAFVLRYRVTCANANGASCGEFDKTFPVAADGTYSVPDFPMGKGERYGLYAFLHIPDSDPKYPYGAIRGEVVQSVTRESADPNDLKLPAFTLLKTDPARLQLSLQSGRDVDSWLKAEGRDEGVNITIGFQITGKPDLNHQFRFDQTGFRLKDWSRVRAHHILLEGEYATNAPVQLTIQYGSHSEEHKSGFSSDFNEMVGAIEIPDQDSPMRPALRTLDNSYNDTYVFLDYEKRDEVDFAEIGFSYATMTVACREGRIEGEIQYRDGQFPNDPPTTWDAVTGVCDGEKGTLRLPLHKKSGETVMVNAPYHRIRAMELDGRGHTYVDKLLITEAVGHDDMDVFQANELTMFLPMTADDGTYYGYLSVGQSKF